jgi:hypothetical protein
VTPAPERPDPDDLVRFTAEVAGLIPTPAPERPDLDAEAWKADPEPPCTQCGGGKGLGHTADCPAVAGDRNGAPVTDAGLRDIEDAMLAIANLPLTKERGDDLLRVIRAAIAAAAAPAPDAGLVDVLDGAINAAENYNGDDIVRITVATAKRLRAALSRQAEKAERPYLTSSEQRRLACVCGHPLIRHTEYGCIDCGTSEATSPQHNFTRTSRQAEKETA